MSSHADKVRELERAVVEAAVAVATTPHDTWGIGLGHKDTCAACEADVALHVATDALLAARAEACETCGGDGDTMKAIGDCGVGVYPCPAGCDNGRKAVSR